MARMDYEVNELDMIHLNPYGAPRPLRFQVGEHECSAVLRVWDGRASYDPDALVLGGDVVIDELEPVWEAVQPNASQVRKMVLVSDQHERFVVVQWRVDW